MDPLEGRPNKEHAPKYGAFYMDLTSKWSNLGTALEENKNDSLAFFRSIPKERSEFRYQPEKWSVNEVILHLVEAERVFQYRAFRFSRKDETALSGFDEDWYAKNNNASARTLESVIEEFEAVRNSTILLFKGMDSEMLDFVGHANNAPVSPRSLGWMTIGHVSHHCQVLRERYL